MSAQLIARSPDLARLRADGYDIEIHKGHLVMAVPYVTSGRAVARGHLISELTLSGDTTAPPGNHVVYFAGATEGEQPCDDQGRVLADLINQTGPFNLAEDLTASCSFSHKPDPTYPDYFEKMSTYAAMLEAYAQLVDPDATARTFPPIPDEDEESVFRYLDSATSRARIGAVTDKLRPFKVVIAGVGGTGSYILDALAKTPVREIHLYDGDDLLTHNAFRAPGAASLDELRARPKKVDYHQARYDQMRRRIVAHPQHVDPSNVDELRDADIVFLAIDGGPGKGFIAARLGEFGVPFIEVGIGLYQTGTSIGGLVRTTASLPDHRDRVRDRLGLDQIDDDDYDQNIQIVELNMLNAALAVIKWKKTVGFYTDFDHELTSTYTVDGNHLLNEENTCE
jgi:ThiF family